MKGLNNGKDVVVGKRMVHKTTIVFILMITLYLGGCSVLTLDGQEPVRMQNRNDTFRFKLFINQYTKKGDINKFAHKTANDITTKNNCRNYELAQILPSNTKAESGSIDFIVFLNCD